MIKLDFTCRFLTDVVLNNRSATQGSVDNLDYIPGSKFLGIVASSLYKEESYNDEDKLDLFHTGAIRFGDAHLLANKERTLKVPLSYHKEKKGKAYDSFNVLKLNEEELHKKKQPKQLRVGYFSPNQLANDESSNLFRLDSQQRVSLKSAYDIEKRRTKDGQMFSYSALAAGLKWQFAIYLTDDKFKESIKNALVGKRRLGKSTSAEYGLVEIEFKEEEQLSSLNKNTVEQGQEVHLYLASNLCLVDQYGFPVKVPTAELLGFEAGEIVWSKSFIRSRQYAPWNTKRKSRDTDRVILEKGSVITVKNKGSDFELDYTNAWGAYRSEGFGEILINPSFLELKEPIRLSEKKDLQDDLAEQKDDSSLDRPLLNFLEARENRTKEVSQITQRVLAFISGYENYFTRVSPSQWGQVRKLAQYASNTDTLEKLLFDKDIGYCCHGKEESQWKPGREYLKDAIRSENNIIDQQYFCIELANQMAQKKKTNEVTSS